MLGSENSLPPNTDELIVTSSSMNPDTDELKKMESSVNNKKYSVSSICSRNPRCVRQNKHTGRCKLGNTKLKYQNVVKSNRRSNTEARFVDEKSKRRKIQSQRSGSLEITTDCSDEENETVDIDLEKFWSSIDEYFSSISKNDLDFIDRMCEANASIVASNANLAFSLDPVLQRSYDLMADQAMPSEDLTLISGRRGRWYSDVWSEQEFLTKFPQEKKSWNIQCISDLKNLVYGYNDDSMIDFIRRLHEAAEKHIASVSLSTRRLLTDSTFGQIPEFTDSVTMRPPDVESIQHHPAGWGQWNRLKKFDVLHNHPASVASSAKTRWKEEAEKSRNSRNYGSDIEIDEISTELKVLISKLLPLCAVNWCQLKRIYDLAHCDFEVQSILQHDKKVSLQLERFYRLIFPEDGKKSFFRIRSTPEDIVNFITNQASQQSTAAMAQATKFAISLILGDSVDALDKNGTWGRGVVMDLYREGDELLRYAKIHFVDWGDECDEWISTFSGRLLPSGMCVQNQILDEKKENFIIL